jgi:hypothetical protein
VTFRFYDELPNVWAEKTPSVDTPLLGRFSDFRHELRVCRSLYVGPVQMLG